MTLGIMLVGCAASDTHKAEEIEGAAAIRSTAAGQPAPDFTLVNDNDDTVGLHELRGRWVVLYFYPADDTPGCTCQATEFTTLLSGFDKLNATVLGISVDPPSKHRLFKAEYKLTVMLLSDPTGATMEKYAAWVETHLGDVVTHRVIRTTYLINPVGTIAWNWPEVLPQGHAARVKAKLEELQSTTK
jgi:thioredoxin-dependent peroxiredoxin